MINGRIRMQATRLMKLCPRGGTAVPSACHKPYNLIRKMCFKIVFMDEKNKNPSSITFFL